MPLDTGIVDSVTNANFKAMAEMQVTNALQHQNRMNAIFESSIGQIVNNQSTPGNYISVIGVGNKIQFLTAHINKTGASSAEINLNLQIF